MMIRKGEEDDKEVGGGGRIVFDYICDGSLAGCLGV